MNDDLLFVYGTLRRAAEHRMHEVLAEGATFVADAAFQGRLYMVRHYPGVVPSADAADVVHGEVYRLHDPLTLLARLDEYEGCGADAVQPAEYARLLLPVRCSDGPTVAAWVYLYNRPVDNLLHLPSGNFFDVRDQ